MAYDFDNMQLPIEPLVLKGAAVEAWAARKEENDSPEASPLDFLSNYQRIQADLIRNIRSLIENVT